MSDFDIDHWPDCPIPWCKNKICLSLNSIYCWPHTPATPFDALKKMLDKALDEEKCNG